MGQLNNDRIFSAIYDSRTLEGADPDVARTDADLVVNAYRNANLATLTNARRRTFETIRNTGAWILGLAALAVGLWLLIFQVIVPIGHSNYAGYGPNKVGKHVEAAAKVYVLSNLTYGSPEKTHYLGHRAWRTTARLPGRTPFCVYVWNQSTSASSDNPNLDGYHVDEGKC